MYILDSLTKKNYLQKQIWLPAANEEGKKKKRKNC